MDNEPKPMSREEEAKEIHINILSCILDECEAKERMKTPDIDGDELRDEQENSYLAYLKAVRLAKSLTKKEFDKFELDGNFDCTYEELEVPEYEDYLKQ